MMISSVSCADVREIASIVPVNVPKGASPPTEMRPALAVRERR
jgi:hypothetical protein